jgi:hypothetical protein
LRFAGAKVHIIFEVTKLFSIFLQKKVSLHRNDVYFLILLNICPTSFLTASFFVSLQDDSALEVE